jgi:hypothetical protein
MKLGFTGTQHGMTDKQKTAFRDFITARSITEFHHGDCIGADKDAHDIVRAMTKARIVIHPPSNDAKRAFCKGDEILPAKPYIARNHDIVDASEHMIAAPQQAEEQLRSGTWATVRYARKRKVKLFVAWP